MSPFGTRAAADELAGVLDGRAVAPEPMQHAVALATALRSTGAQLEAAIAPRPEFRDALRMRLVAVATVQAAAPVEAPARSSAVSWSIGRRAQRGSAVAAGALASVVAVSGVAVAGSQSLPGDPFYGVKRTTEAFQLRTADGDVEKGTLHLDLAATRLREVRGLTLGRDAVDSGPTLGPAAMAGGITLRSATQPLAEGSALSPEVAQRVKDTLAEMDDQTREGTSLLTDAYRSSRAAEPLRALSRFATRQSAGLEELLPALPPATQERARVSLALLTGVNDTADELLEIGSCGTACDPSQAAPTAPSAGGSSTAPGSSTTDPCVCAEPAPSPAPQPSAAPPAQPSDSSTSSPGSTRSPEPAPSSPAPAPSRSSDPLPVPVPSTPLPLPSVPLPLPTITVPPLEPLVEELVEPVLPGIGSSSSTGSAPAPTPEPTPTPEPAPVPVAPAVTTRT